MASHVFSAGVFYSLLNSQLQNVAWDVLALISFIIKVLVLSTVVSVNPSSHWNFPALLSLVLLTVSLQPPLNLRMTLQYLQAFKP